MTWQNCFSILAATFAFVEQQQQISWAMWLCRWICAFWWIWCLCSHWVPFIATASYVPQSQIYTRLWTNFKDATDKHIHSKHTRWLQWWKIHFSTLEFVPDVAQFDLFFFTVALWINILIYNTFKQPRAFVSHSFVVFWSIDLLWRTKHSLILVSSHCAF